MAERIELPPTLQGDEQSQLQQVWRYLYQLADAINNNLEAIGGNDLTDAERVIMQQITGSGGGEEGIPSEYETLKSLIIKTADFVKTSLQEYRMVLFGETEAAGQHGTYYRREGMDVAVTPDGVLQKFSLREIVKDLKTYEINAKNYIKTGLLRTVNSVPVYGVAIGKDVVTFSNDGTETYNDGNKVAELTADELSFWQNGAKVAGYTGSRISFYYNGSEAFYIQQGKLYAVGDMEITNGKKLILASGADMEVKSGGDLNIKSGGKMTVESGGSLKVASGGNIDINASGTLNLTGSSVNISSGSTFIVNATNFRIDSASKLMDLGNWSFQTIGLLYENQSDRNECEFAVGSYASCGYRVGTPKVSVVYDLQNNVPYLYVTLKTKHDVYSRLIMKSDQDGIILKGDDDTVNWLGQPSSDEWNIYGRDIYVLNTYQRSSRYYKENIRPMESMGEKLDRLEPVTFRYKKDDEGKKRAGLIYEDTVGILPEICSKDGETRAINYTELIPMLLKEIQELRARVAALEEREGGQENGGY